MAEPRGESDEPYAPAVPRRDSMGRPFAPVLPRRSLFPRLIEPFTPPLRALRRYEPRDLPRDLLAGLTMAAVDMPQSMALALIAGVPPIYGLYTAIVLGGLGALFSSSRLISVGPTNTQSLLVAAVVSRMTHDGQLYLELAFGLSLLKGLMQLGFSVAGVARFASYVSRSVMVGFTAGAGVLIVLGQLPPLLGLPPPTGTTPWPSAVTALQRVTSQLHAVDVRCLGLGALAFALMLLARRRSPLIPGALLAVISGALVVSIAGLGPDDIALVGPLPLGLPVPHVPSLTLAQIEALIPGALALALLGMLESVAIAKGTARRIQDRVRPEQELFGQGLSNLIGSFLSCLPGSASFSRTALLLRSGARTRFASLFCSVFIALLLLGFGGLTAHVPFASLAAILIAVAGGMLDWNAALRIARSNRTDAVVCGGTFVAALLLPLAYAIYLGIFLNLTLYLRQASRLRVTELVRENGSFVERAFPRGAPVRELMFLQLEGDLFFAVADELEERLAELARSGALVVIFRLKRARWVDASVLFVFEQFAQAMKQAGGHLILCGVRPELREQLRDSGIDLVIGEANIIETRASVFASAHAAIARGEALLREAHGERAAH